MQGLELTMKDKRIIHSIFSELWCPHQFKFIAELTPQGKKAFIKRIGASRAPFVKNINQKILAEIDKDTRLLNMALWHNDTSTKVKKYESAFQQYSKCGTQHCWAGWAVNLAGEEGYILEHKTCTPYAALCIMKRSNPKMNRIPDFFSDNYMAYESIKEFAEQEKLLEQGEAK